MRVRRLAIAGAALAAVIGLGGCGTPGGGDAPATGGTTTAATKAPADPAAELAAAATALQDESMRVSMRMATGINSEGVVNADGSAMDMSMTMTGAAAGGEGGGKIEMRKVGDDLYMRFNGADTKWMHAAASDFPTGSTFASNPKDTSKMITVTTGVEKTGDRSFKGVLDMTKAPGADAKSFAALGAKATAVPFTAATDAEGRLSELVIDLETLAPGAGKMTATYTDFGLAVDVTAPPADEVRPMPKDMLKMMGN